MKIRHTIVCRELMRFWYNCKFGNIHENFIFANSDERDICDVKISRLGHDLPLYISKRQSDRAKSKGFYFIFPRENFRIYSSYL